MAEATPADTLSIGSRVFLSKNMRDTNGRAYLSDFLVRHLQTTSKALRSIVDAHRGFWPSRNFDYSCKD